MLAGVEIDCQSFVIRHVFRNLIMVPSVTPQFHMRERVHWFADDALDSLAGYIYIIHKHRRRSRRQLIPVRLPPSTLVQLGNTTKLPAFVVQPPTQHVIPIRIPAMFGHFPTFTRLHNANRIGGGVIRIYIRIGVVDSNLNTRACSGSASYICSTTER